MHLHSLADNDQQKACGDAALGKQVDVQISYCFSAEPTTTCSKGYLVRSAEKTPSSSSDKYSRFTSRAFGASNSCNKTVNKDNLIRSSSTYESGLTDEQFVSPERPIFLSGSGDSTDEAHLLAELSEERHKRLVSSACKRRRRRERREKYRQQQQDQQQQLVKMIRSTGSSYNQNYGNMNGHNQQFDQLDQAMQQLQQIAASTVQNRPSTGQQISAHKQGGSVVRGGSLHEQRRELTDSKNLNHLSAAVSPVKVTRRLPATPELNSPNDINNWHDKRNAMLDDLLQRLRASAVAPASDNYNSTSQQNNNNQHQYNQQQKVPFLAVSSPKQRQAVGRPTSFSSSTGDMSRIGLRLKMHHPASPGQHRLSQQQVQVAQVRPVPSLDNDSKVNGDDTDTDYDNGPVVTSTHENDSLNEDICLRVKCATVGTNTTSHVQQQTKRDIAVQANLSHPASMNSDANEHMRNRSKNRQTQVLSPNRDEPMQPNSVFSDLWTLINSHYSLVAIRLQPAVTAENCSNTAARTPAVSFADAGIELSTTTTSTQQRTAQPTPLSPGGRRSNLSARVGGAFRPVSNSAAQEAPGRKQQQEFFNSSNCSDVNERNIRLVAIKQCRPTGVNSACYQPGSDTLISGDCIVEIAGRLVLGLSVEEIASIFEETWSKSVAYAQSTSPSRSAQNSNPDFEQHVGLRLVVARPPQLQLRSPPLQRITNTNQQNHAQVSTYGSNQLLLENSSEESSTSPMSRPLTDLEKQVYVLKQQYESALYELRIAAAGVNDQSALSSHQQQQQQQQQQQKQQYQNALGVRSLPETRRNKNGEWRPRHDSDHVVPEYMKPTQSKSGLSQSQNSLSHSKSSNSSFSTIKACSQKSSASNSGGNTSFIQKRLQRLRKNNSTSTNKKSPQISSPPVPPQRTVSMVTNNNVGQGQLHYAIAGAVSTPIATKAVVETHSPIQKRLSKMQGFSPVVIGGQADYQRYLQKLRTSGSPCVLRKITGQSAEPSGAAGKSDWSTNAAYVANHEVDDGDFDDDSCMV